MKLKFKLAIVSEENQNIEKLIKPYIRVSSENNLEECINNNREFIVGVMFGDIHEEFLRNELLIEKKNKNEFVSTAKIKDVDWKAIENNYKKIFFKEEINLKDNFMMSDSLITPDGKWHGMIPLDENDFGFSSNKIKKDYLKDYYNKYIKPYESNGRITILECSM